MSWRKRALMSLSVVALISIPTVACNDSAYYNNKANILASKLIIKAYKDRRIVQNKKNRITLLSGLAYNRELEKREPAIGVGYQRKVTDDFSLGVTIHSDDSVYGTVGFDF